MHSLASDAPHLLVVSSDSVKGSRVSYKRSNEGDPIVSGVEMPMVAFSPSEEPVNERPTAAQAAAGRLQRASARQAAKAAQQQRRHAHARLAADHINTTFKRSAEQAVSAEEVDVGMYPKVLEKRSFLPACISSRTRFFFSFFLLCKPD